MNKAFTLIELLAVIVILAIIALIAIPIVLNIVEDTKRSATIRSAEMYVHGIEIDVINQQLNKKELEDGQYNIIEFTDIEVNGEKPVDGMVEILEGKVIDYSLKIGNYIVNYDKESNKPVISEELRKAEPNVYLVEGMIPVQYKDSNWIVVDASKRDWYNYNKQEWANAVILNTGVTKNIGDTVDVTSEVKGMLVYIPRYEYRIEGQYGKGGTSASNPGEIEINFVTKRVTNASEGYRVHPGFTFGEEELNGIWVGKFETTGTKEDPTILPNVSSLRSQNVSNQFATAQKFNSYIKNGDSHMMKNSEWGAVAYLSQSKYGKYGNNMYTGINKEIYQNRDRGFITGHSNGTPSTNTTNTQCAYDILTDRGNGTGSCGGGASTTGNITGVYDMSGGTWEYVMGYLTTASSTWGATSSSNNAGFTSEPNTKYYDAYATTTATTACNSGICYGQALSETSSWYGDIAEFVSSSSPWFARGGGYDSVSGAGVFYFSYVVGNANSYYSFRVVSSSITS